MALSTVPGYGTPQGIRNTIGAPASIDQPVKFKPLIGQTTLGGLGLGSGGGSYVGTGSGLGSGQVTATTPGAQTLTPIQTYQQQIGDATTGAEGIFGAQTSSLAAARADAIQRAVIQGGWNPGQLSGSLASYAGDITPDTLSAAAANPMSQKAQLDLQLQQAQQNQPYDLAASGMGRSGAAAINAGNLQRQYQTSAYQGTQGLLDSIYGAANTYAGGYNTAMQNLENARASAAYYLAQQPGYSQPIGGDTSTNTGSDPYGGGLAPNTVADTSDPNTIQWGTPTSQAVQRVIQQLGIKSGSTVNSNLYQNIRNMRAG